MATPFNKMDEGMPIIQTPSTIQNLGMIQSIASRTRAKAIKECERKQHAMASEMIGTAISRIQGIVHENGKLVGQPDVKNTLKRLNVSDWWNITLEIILTLVRFARNN